MTNLKQFIITEEDEARLDVRLLTKLILKHRDTVKDYESHHASKVNQLNRKRALKEKRQMIFKSRFIDCQIGL